LDEKSKAYSKGETTTMYLPHFRLRGGVPRGGASEKELGRLGLRGSGGSSSETTGARTRGRVEKKGRRRRRGGKGYYLRGAAQDQIWNNITLSKWRGSHLGGEGGAYVKDRGGALGKK